MSESEKASDPRAEFRSLLKKGSLEPRELRRIAELVELLYSQERAIPWWGWAARAGNQDAVDYLAVLKSEGLA